LTKAKMIVYASFLAEL